MADIKQAAKWMREGKIVRRSDFPDCEYRVDPKSNWDAIMYRSPRIAGSEFVRMATTHTADLLADDWEIADGRSA